MPKVHRSPPPLHLVVVDTNILWDKDKKLPVCVAFDEFLARNSSLVPMELHVPEVVFGELHFQQATSALKALSNITENFSELAGITNSPYSHKCNESAIRTQVGAKLQKWLNGHDGKLLATPISKINWAAVVDAAIWRKAPFSFDPKDKTNEKGFRDAVILETLVHLCEATTVGKTVIFVCNDYLLRTTTESRLKSSKKFLAFESLADFEAYISLTQQQFTNAFVKAIQHHARRKFYAKGDATCIYARFDLVAKLRTDYAADLSLQDSFTGGLNLLSTIGTAAKWKVLRQAFWIRSTQFTKLEGSREFHWSSRVDVAMLYENEPSGGLIASALPAVQRVQVVGFDVKWKANVKTDGRFHDIDLVGLEKKETQLRDATPENLKELSLSST